MVDVGKGGIGLLVAVLGVGIGVGCADRDPISAFELSGGGSAGSGPSGGRGGTQNLGGASSGGKGSGAMGGTNQAGLGGKGGAGGASTNEPGGAGGQAGRDDGPSCTAAMYVNDERADGGEGGGGGQDAGLSPVPTWARTSDGWQVFVEAAPGGDFIVVGVYDLCDSVDGLPFEESTAIARLRPDGTVVWNRALPGSGWGPEKVASSASGETFILTTVLDEAEIDGQRFEGTGTTGASLVLKLDARGELVWVHGPLMGAGSLEQIALAPDGRGGVAFAGFLIDSPTDDDRHMVVGSIDAAGDLRWSKTYGDDTIGLNVVVDSLGELLVKGCAATGATADLGSAVPPADGCFLLKLDENGNYRWHKAANQVDSIAKGRGESHLVLRFHGDTAPDPWTLGRYQADGSVLFEKPASEGYLVRMGGARIVTALPYLVTYDLEGEPIGSYPDGTGFPSGIDHFAVTARDDILVFGTFEERMDFGFTRVEQGDVEDTQGYLLALKSP
jgi:hypothetical protein